MARRQGAVESRGVRRIVVEQLTVTAYWIASISAGLAVILRLLAFFGIWVFRLSPGRATISHMTFRDGAVLFFLMAIAGSLLSRSSMVLTR